MNNPLVSIIIPVYNAAEYLEEAILSTTNQTWANKEIILVDDGSTDGSLAIARQYESDTVKVFSQQNKGASAARNKGLREAKGDYIQFLDADDLLGCDKIDQQVKALAGTQNQLAVGGTVHFINGTDPLKIAYNFGPDTIIDPIYFLLRLYGGHLIEAGYEGMIQPNAWLTPKEIINKAGYWNEDLTLDDDGEFFCRVILASSNIVYTANSINYYRKFTQIINLSAGKNYAAMKSSLIANELKYQHLKKASDDKRVNIALAKLFIESAVTYYPQYMDLYNIANKRIKQLGDIGYIPAIGGRKIELIKRIFGWKFSKYLLYMFNQFR